MSRQPLAASRTFVFLLTTLNGHGVRDCYIGWSVREVIAMQNYSDGFNAAITFNEYLVKAALEYMQAMSFPALYYAKYL